MEAALLEYIIIIINLNKFMVVFKWPTEKDFFLPERIVAVFSSKSFACVCAVFIWPCK